MRIFFFVFFFLRTLYPLDCDCLFVGSSPVFLLEALYQHFSGKKVIILEQDAICGGAWKAVSACGVPHVDLGCHLLGSSSKMKAFLEEYVGCHLVPMDHPDQPDKPLTSNGYYFSHGCHELIEKLVLLLRQNQIPLLLEHRVENVSVDLATQCAKVETSQGLFTAKKVFYSSFSSFRVEGKESFHVIPYPHLYLLIQDSGPTKFSYVSGGPRGVSRMMNLTPFVDLKHTGRQLIVFQLHSKDSIVATEEYLETLKAKHLISPSAYALTTDFMIYQAKTAPPLSATFAPYFELINANSIHLIEQYSTRWKQVLPKIPS